MGWRDEPVTKGELVDAIEAAVAKVAETQTKVMKTNISKLGRDVINVASSAIKLFGETIVENIKN